MKTTHTNKSTFALAAIAAAMLTACGGGGGDAPGPAAGGGGVGSFTATCTGGTTQSSTVSQADAAAKCPAVGTTPTGSATLVLSVPAPTYAAGTEELAAFTLLNAERSRCGFGMLAQSTQLDLAAKGHADYAAYNFITGHFQNQQQYPVLFTGTTANDRAVAQGYVGSIGEDIAYSLSTSTIGGGVIGTRNLLAAPYHLAGMVRGNRDVGIAVRSNLDTTPKGAKPFSVVQFNFGIKASDTRQQIASDAIAYYPCDGSVGVDRKLAVETPNPIPGRDLFANPAGTPIYMMARFGNTLGVSSVVLRETLTNTAVVLRTPILAANDPQSRFLSHEAYVAPDAPLKPLTNYTAVVNGSNNGIAFKPITFSFTTGN